MLIWSIVVVTSWGRDKEGCGLHGYALILGLKRKGHKVKKYKRKRRKGEQKRSELKYRAYAIGRHTNSSKISLIKTSWKENGEQEGMQ